MTWAAAPRLILLADEPQFAQPLSGAEFSFHIARFLSVLARSHTLDSRQCGVWLRGHGHGWDWWTERLQRLSWLGETGLQLGISAPIDSPSAVPPAKMPHKLAWLQVSEAQASAWPAGAVSVARSCHDAAGVAQALAAGAAWVTLSPVRPTPSKPGHAGLGWPSFAAVAEKYPNKVIALGGIAAEDLADAWRAHAAGVAVQRAWTGDAEALVAACA